MAGKPSRGLAGVVAAATALSDIGARAGRLCASAGLSAATAGHRPGGRTLAAPEAR